MGESIAATGYANVWVRDNVCVAFAHHATGVRHIGTEVVGVLIAFFSRYGPRFDGIISGAVDPQDVANRPHVRFDGRSSARSETSAGHTRRTTRSDTSGGCRQRWLRAAR
jgi:phosphorylase kinase alpha/beta subunit